MDPGLHELDCRNCGAPINPPAASTVVRCAHCGQPHMWIAPEPGAQGKWVAESTAVRAGRVKALVIAGAGLAVLLIAMGVVSALFWRRHRSAPAAEVVPADAPLTVGDALEWHRTPNDSCEGFVAALLPAGTVAVQCGDETVSTARALLTFESYTFMAPEPDDVALERTPTGWSRVVVTGLDAGKRVRVEPLLGGQEHGADTATLRVVWRRSSGAGVRWLPLPASVALEPGDVVDYRDGGVIRTGKLTRVTASDVEVAPGYENNGVFEPEQSAVAARRARSTLLAQLCSPLSPPASNRVLVAEQSGKWLRATLVSAGEHGRWTLHADGGADQWVTWGGQVLTLLHS